MLGSSGGRLISDDQRRSARGLRWGGLHLPVTPRRLGDGQRNSTVLAGQSQLSTYAQSFCKQAKTAHGETNVRCVRDLAKESTSLCSRLGRVLRSVRLMRIVRRGQRGGAIAWYRLFRITAWNAPVSDFVTMIGTCGTHDGLIGPARIDLV